MLLRDTYVSEVPALRSKFQSNSFPAVVEAVMEPALECSAGRTYFGHCSLERMLETRGSLASVHGRVLNPFRAVPDESRPEMVVHVDIDDGVVAGVGHREPVEGEPHVDDALPRPYVIDHQH